MGKALKKVNNDNQKRIPIQQSTVIRKQTYLDKGKFPDEKKRMMANIRERERTKQMNNCFNKLSSKFDKCLIINSDNLTKKDILMHTKKYLEYLDLMKNNEEFFRRYSVYDLQHGFELYLFENTRGPLNKIS